MSEAIVFVNGAFVPKSEAQVSVFDRGFLFADGVYEVVPVVPVKPVHVIQEQTVKSQAVDFEPFVERFQYSMRELSLHWPDQYVADYGADFAVQLKGLLADLSSKNNLQEGGIYLQVTRGVAPRDFAFPDLETTPASLVAFTFEKPILESPHAATGVKVVTTEDLRWKRRDIKSVALLAQCLAKQTASNNKAFEAWMIEDGYVTEGSSSSAYIVNDGKIITRPLSNKILPGIRRKVLFELAEQHGIAIEERLFTVEEAYAADEAFMSSATTLVLPITQIDDKQIADGKVGPISQKARQLYIEALKSQLV